MKKKEWKCPFCGSKKLHIETPFMDRVTGEHETTFCCAKQIINARYAEKRFGQDGMEAPNTEDISHL